MTNIKSVTASQMTEIDRRSQEEYGISQEVLMENAGVSVYDQIAGDNPIHKQIIIFCGKGNNGGDGFVVARHLWEKSNKDIIIFLLSNEIREGSARNNFKKAKDMGIKMYPVEEFFSFSTKDCIYIDSIFGTGFKGDLPEKIKTLGNLLNGSKSKIYAVDIPSGLNATTGETSSGTLKAYKTVTFGLPKKGFYQGNGPNVCGQIIVKDIGFPKGLLREYQ